MYKLLIVDDETETAAALRNYFPWGEMGFEVVAQPKNGREALAYILANHVDVVLCDIIMPVMTGVELAKELNERKIKLYLLFLSGHREFEFAQKAVVYGVKNYILKPTNYEELVKVFTDVKAELDSLNAGSEEPHPTVAGDKVTLSVKEFINLNYRNVTLESAAKHVHMNPNYLSQFFRQKTGQGFSEYLLSVKMKKAAALLSGIDYKVYEIGDMVGYSNTQNFTRAFRSYFGASPQEYRKSLNVNGAFAEEPSK